MSTRPRGKMRAVIGWYSKQIGHYRDGRPICVPVDILECGHAKHMPPDYRLIDHLKTALQTANLQPVGKRLCRRCANGVTP